MKHHSDRPKQIIKTNSKPCKACKKDMDKKLLFDDYEEELNEYAMDAPGSYQGASVWGGTGNFGIGGTKQISGQRLNRATKNIYDLEQNLQTADQKNDSSYEDEYAEWRLKTNEDKFEDHGIKQEAYPTMSTKPGTGSTFANLPGYPAPNTIVKKMEFIPDDAANEEAEAMFDQEREWLDHIYSQPQTNDPAANQGRMAAVQQGGGPNGVKTNPKPAAPRNTNTPSNGLGYSALAAPKQYVPNELDQYRDDTKDILWKIGRRNTY